MAMAAIFGDGLHDDTTGIQALLDTGAPCVALPPPQAFYLISRPLVLHSNQELRLDRWSEVRLAPKSNCHMLTNDDYEKGNRNIAVTGGIWNGNNLQQAPNPQMVAAHDVREPGRVRRMAMPVDWPSDPVTGKPQPLDHNAPWHPKRYWGDLTRFVNVRGFSMVGVTFKDPVTYAMHAAKLVDFTFADITFDFNEGNPSPNNMDGLHFDGGCRFGRIANVHGACYDDMLAFNAEDGTEDSPFMGPISDIEVDGVFAERTHSCARFLSNGSRIANITIRNVHGTFYRYAFGFTHYFPERPLRGVFDALSFENLFIAKALPLESDWNCCPDWGLFWGEGRGDLSSIRVVGLHRIEETTPTPCFEFARDFTIGRMSIEHCTVENRHASPVDFIRNDGQIGSLFLRDVSLRSADGAGPVAEIAGGGRIDRLVRDGEE